MSPFLNFLQRARFLSLTSCAIAALLLSASCHDSSSSPTSPGTATIMGTVILGSGSFGARVQDAIPLSQVTVRLVANGQATQTDSSGNFTLSGAPTGNVEMEFTRADINARGSVTLASGTNQITASVVGSRAVITPRGHAGEEIEGVVQSVNVANNTFTVLDQRLGTVTVSVDGTTLIRRGNNSQPLSSITGGTRVHVKAVLQSGTSYLATEVLIQGESTGGDRDAEGTVASVNSADKSFVVTTESGAVTVHTTATTSFKKKGSPASFADVVAGAMVEAEGTLQSDGSILASKVTIE